MVCGLWTLYKSVSVHSIVCNYKEGQKDRADSVDATLLQGLRDAGSVIVFEYHLCEGYMI